MLTLALRHWNVGAGTPEAATVNETLPPGQEAWFVGWVVTAGDVLMLSVAAEEVEPPRRAAERNDEPDDASPPLDPNAAAPIARVPEGESARETKQDRWTPADVAVILAAIAIIALSLAGLVWLLKN